MNILILYDVEGWAWHFKCQALQKHLANDFDKIDIAPSKWIKNNLSSFKRYHHISWMGWMEGNRWAGKYKGTSAGVSSFNYYYRHWDMAKKIMNNYGALTATCKILYDDLEKNKLNRNIYPCQNGVDEEMFQPDPIKHDKFVVGWMGQPTTGGFNQGDKSIDMHGYQHVLLPLVESLRGNKNVEFKIMAKTFKNAVPHDDMVKWYNGLDLFLHTGFGTGTPNGVFEAMACGVPCISTAIGAAPEVIQDNFNGYLIPRYYNKGDTLSIVSTFKTHINILEADRSLLKGVGEEARRTIEESWTWKKRARKWIDVFIKHGKRL